MTRATLTNTVTSTLHQRSVPRPYAPPSSSSPTTTPAASHAFSAPPSASVPPPAASSRVRLCIDNVWFDLTHWQHQHPGGPAILSHLNNQDATEAFYSLHSADAIARLERMKRTALCSPVREGEILPLDAATASFRQLRSQLQAEGWFRRSVLWELFYALSVYVLAAVGTACAWWGGWWRVAAVLCVALSMQQAGWIGHDYVHGRGRYQRWLGRSMSGLINAFSPTWWSSKHNTHHVFTSAAQQQHSAGTDSALQLHALPLTMDSCRLLSMLTAATMLALTWTSRMTPSSTFSIQRQRMSAQQPRIPLRLVAFPGLELTRCCHAWIVLCQDVWFRRYQHLYFIPVASFLFVSWRIQSLQHVIRSNNVWEMLPILCNLCWLCSLGLPVAFLSVYLAGGLVAVIVTASHQSEEMLPAVPLSPCHYNFVSCQFATTRDARCGNALMEWLWGGMQYQLEHHLFPTMPKYRYAQLCSRVQQWAQQQGLDYKVDSVWEIWSRNYHTMKLFAGSAATAAEPQPQLH